MSRWMCAVLFAGLSAVSFAGCSSQEETEELTVVSEPLELDPTQKISYVGWWSNGRELLRLDEVESYVLWPSQNVYQKPIERGRWRQASYAEVWIEPYFQPNPVQTRVGATKTEGLLQLNIDGYAPFTRIDRAPAAVEDAILGLWAGEHGTLRLDPDLTCEFVHTRPAEAPVAITRYRGTWRLDGLRLLVAPDAPSIASSRYTLTTSSGAVTALEGASGTLTRVNQPAPAP